MDQEMIKTRRILIAEWISTIGVFIACFLFLLYRIESQGNRAEARTDKLYEMFIEVVKSNGRG